ncbi:hypothetical protein EVAR_65467_1 [Eumeta japonica]|uniref:Uncharacterized protein n=1 Tax=Eumeta variegata TaxID=151549 RepID=A0A4C1YUT1_EUMVA|nr:hypothetical protein EVAR_65467_1 [Eumeta japonica]
MKLCLGGGRCGTTVNRCSECMWRSCTRSNRSDRAYQRALEELHIGNTFFCPEDVDLAAQHLSGKSRLRTLRRLHDFQHQ